MSPSRLVVALEPDEDSLLLVEGYARLAAELRRDLLALLVEDAELDAALALPFARIQSRRAAGDAVIGPSSARHALSVFRRRMETRMGEACRRLAVSWRLDVAGALPIPVAGDILVFGPRGPRATRRIVSPATAACPVVLLRPTGRSVVVLYEGSPESLMLGAAVARRERLPISILAWAETPEAAERLAWQARIEAGAGDVVALVDDGKALARSLAAMRPRAVVVDPCNASIRLDSIVAALG
jgi:hypothetical protein